MQWPNLFAVFDNGAHALTLVHKSHMTGVAGLASAFGIEGARRQRNPRTSSACISVIEENKRVKDGQTADISNLQNFGTVNAGGRVPHGLNFNAPAPCPAAEVRTNNTRNRATLQIPSPNYMFRPGLKVCPEDNSVPHVSRKLGIAAAIPVLSGTLSLLLHCSIESVHIYFPANLLRHQTGQIGGKSQRIVSA
jgi:hypothetical protein